MKSLITLCLVGLMFSACNSPTPKALLKPNDRTIEVDTTLVMSKYNVQTDTSTLRVLLMVRMLGTRMEQSNANSEISINKLAYINSGNESDRAKGNKWVLKYNKLLKLYKRQEDTLYRIYKYPPQL